MAKVNKSITLDKDICIQGEKQAKKEHHSFSSFMEKLLAEYLTAIKKITKNGT
jgi:hypothetical protein